MADFITVNGEYAPSGIYEFYKDVYVEKNCKVSIRAFAVMRYILYINGEYVCEGPCKSSEDIRYYDELKEVRLQKGRNEIKMVVMHLLQQRKFSTVYKSVKPIVLLEARGTDFNITTDISWKCCFLSGYKLLHHPKYFQQLPPQEEIFAEEDPVPLEIMVMENSNGFDFDEGFVSWSGLVNGYHLQKRPIPMIYSGDEIAFKVIKSGENFVELDAGTYVTAKIEAVIGAQADVEILYSECYQQEDGKYRRDDSSGFLKGYSDKIHTGEKEYTFQSFWFRAFRFIRVESKDISLTLLALKAYKCAYPLEITGEFHCSDELYNQMQEVSENTMLACMHETFVDCPYYEQQQYCMDSAIESAVLMRMSHDTRMVRKCISEFAASQQPDGLLAANYPADHLQVIPGFSLFWILLLKDYLDYSKDIDFVRAHIGTMDKILVHFDEQVRKNGYVTKSKHWWNYVDWVPGWDNGIPNVNDGEAFTIYNLYYASALLAAQYICEAIGRSGLAEEYRERYARLKKTLLACCYDESKNLFRDGSETAEFSEHVIIWAVLSDMVSGSDAKEMMKRIFDKDIYKSTFSMNYYLFRALEKSDCYEYAFRIFEQWTPMLENHCTTWCEKPGKPRSECHGWSSAPLYEFSANILGVKCDLKEELLIAPKSGKLTFAKGIVPTRFGNVLVDWKRKGNEFEIEVNAPETVIKRIILPGGREIVFSGSHYSVCSVLTDTL